MCRVGVVALCRVRHGGMEDHRAEFQSSFLAKGIPCVEVQVHLRKVLRRLRVEANLFQ